MSYQVIRGAIEMATALALHDAGVGHVFFDNVDYAQPGTDETYAEIAVTCTDVKQDVIGCCGANDFGGTVTVYINTLTGFGARQGEEFALAVPVNHTDALTALLPAARKDKHAPRLVDSRP